MGRAYRPKHQVLQQFTKTLFEHNPMQLNLADNPSADTEYESEALSILSRFNEAALQLCEDENLQREIAVNIVQQGFEFWFSDPKVHRLEELAFALLATYRDSYPVREQAPPVEVPSER